MRILSRFLEVPFDDIGIGLGKLVRFTLDHIQRMIANNVGHELDTRITATQGALTLVLSHATDDETKLALRKAHNQTKTDFRVALPGKVAMSAAAITAKYGPASVVMTECFPLGRSIFSTSPIGDLAKHLETLQNGITAHAADLGPQVVADTAALVTGWAAVHAASEIADGAKISTQEAKQLARENLQLMLFLNLLKIAEMYARQPEKLALYMQQSLLENHPAQPDEPTPPAPTPPPAH